MPDEKSCGAVVFREDRDSGRSYLLLHYEEGHWDFPKGHVEEGESETGTARRETIEETGIKELEFLPGFRERIDYYYRHGAALFHKEVFFFIARTDETAVNISKEHIGYVWLPYGKARERLTYPNAKEVLRKAESFLSSRL
jgi:8-oxo-dGTP pyrophosphatase MutT (NUDIX family)